MRRPTEGVTQMMRETRDCSRRDCRIQKWGLVLAAVGFLNVALADDASPARSEERRQIDTLTSELKAVQAQLRELAEQNRALLEMQQRTEQRQQALERQI